MKKYLYMLPLVGALAACSPQTFTKKEATATVNPAPVQMKREMTGMMPKATAFRMTGDYAGNVAITVGPDGKLTYYPAPSDISRSSIPVSLGNGWYLNNQGIGKNAVFTKYTFEEYSKLPSAPSPQQLLEAVIPGAEVEQMVVLPFTINEAKDNISKVKDYLKSL